MVPCITLGLGKLLDNAAISDQRAREGELLYVGNLYRDAIRQYSESTPAGARPYPDRLDDLLRDPRYPVVRRYLRRPYPDPFTGRAFEPVSAPGAASWAFAARHRNGRSNWRASGTIRQPSPPRRPIGNGNSAMCRRKQDCRSSRRTARQRAPLQAGFPVPTAQRRWRRTPRQRASRPTFTLCAIRHPNHPREPIPVPAVPAIPARHLTAQPPPLAAAHAAGRSRRRRHRLGRAGVVVPASRCRRVARVPPVAAWTLLGLACLGTLCLGRSARARHLWLAAFGAALLALLGWWHTIKPSHERVWADDVARLLEARVEATAWCCAMCATSTGAARPTTRRAGRPASMTCRNCARPT